MEVALAILVMALGVVAVFSMIATGLDANAMAVADTQACLFADSVFRGIRAESINAATGMHPEFPPDQIETAQERWEEFWTKFKNGNLIIPVAAPDTWKVSPQPIKPGGGMESPKFTIKAMRSGVGGDRQRIESIENHTLRYRLKLEQSGDTAYKATLSIWEGKFGSDDPKHALVFYTEFYNPGDL